MSKKLLFISLAVALCGCGDTASTPPTTAKNSVTTGPADPVTSAKPVDNQDHAAKSEPAGKEEMAEKASGAGPNNEKPAVAGKEGSPAPEGDQPAPGATVEKEAAKKEAGKEDGKPEKVTVQKAFQAASRAMQKDDVKGALAELEKAVPDNPEDANLLLNLAALSQRVAGEDPENPDYELYKKAGGYLRQALKADASLAENPNIGNFGAGIYYNEACALSKEEKAADAMKVLQESVAMGFKSLAKLENDEDLAAVRTLPEFPEFLAKTRDAIKERQQKELAEIFAETKPFDFNFELTDIEGKAIALADLKGKVAIIDVWGTWCPPCRKEIPHFVELQTKYKEAGLEIVGLNSERTPDAEQALEAVKEFHKENKMNYRCALIQNDIIEQIPGFEGFPTTLFIDRTGKVRAKTVGYKELEVLDMIITALLEEKPEGDKPAADKSDENTEKEAKSGETGK